MQGMSDDSFDDHMDEDHMDDRFAKSAVPTNVLVLSNLPPSLLESEMAMNGLQHILSMLGEVDDAELLESECRARVVFSTRNGAICAMGELNGKIIGGKQIYAHYAPRQDPARSAMQYLDVPMPMRQFLISPPASPPVGWEPVEEDPPVVDEEFLLTEFTESFDPRAPRIILQSDGDMPAICVCDYSDQRVDDSLTQLNGKIKGGVGSGAGGLKPSRQLFGGGSGLAVPSISKAQSHVPPHRRMYPNPL